MGAAAAASPLAESPPGVEQFVLTPPPARAMIDQQIMDVEERLDKRIADLMKEMNAWSAQLAGRIDQLLGSATAAPAAAAAATPTALPGQAPRLDPWAQSRAGAPEASSTAVARLQPAQPPESLGLATGIGAALRAPHPKEVEKPTVYDGNAAAWRLWAISFKRFLRRNDERWPALLEAVEKLKGRPIEASDEAHWWTTLSLGPTPMEQWKSQLNEFMESFTKSLAREVVDSQGEHGALGAWGTLADRGHSLREEHLHHLLLMAYTL